MLAKIFLLVNNNSLPSAGVQKWPDDGNESANACQDTREVSKRSGEVEFLPLTWLRFRLSRASRTPTQVVLLIVITNSSLTVPYNLVKEWLIIIQPFFDHNNNQ